MVAEYAGHEFKRCPATFVGERETHVVARARSGFFEALTPIERLRLPAKLHAAYEHCAYLLELQKVPRGAAA